MTSSENAPREALVDVLDPIVGPAYASNAPKAADAVIQHLWNRADDPEVVEAVANAVSRTCTEDIAQRYYDAGGEPPRIDDLRNDEEDRVATVTIAEILTALLGPRPSGE